MWKNSQCFWSQFALKFQCHFANMAPKETNCFVCKQYMILYLSKKLTTTYIPLPITHSKHCAEGNKLFLVTVKNLMFLFPINAAIPMSHCLGSILSQLYLSMTLILSTFYRVFEWKKWLSNYSACNVLNAIMTSKVLYFSIKFRTV